MDPARYRRLRELFPDAAALPPADRSGWLAALGPADADLRPQLAAMLREHARAEAAAAPLAAGQVVAGRYRVVSRLGEGGMGAVYRADDLVLGQPVALKFLRPGRTLPGPLDALRREARLAREVSHPNVCRVFDIAEADGRPFLSMEYVDGEDLASLLRRIGRLPPEKAADVARQVCEGLHAAHARGILHRDLKPANVLLDAHGRVRLTDFGIASALDRRDGPAAAAGTPAYMAPEQFAGGELSVRTDVYALGLVLYELFTGRPAFAGRTAADYALLHRNATPVDASAWVTDLDPRVERVIARCLEKDPARRPGSALGVAAGLPGGDPLAAALAAGETPDPDLVAACAQRPLRPPAARLALAGTLLGLAAATALAPLTSPLARAPFDRPPAAYAEVARAVLRAAGADGYARDRACGFRADRAYQAAVHQAPPGAAPPAGDGGLGRFWYREAAEPLATPHNGGRVEAAEPARGRPGHRLVELDPAGRLVTLEVAAGRVPDAPAGPPGRADFGPLVRAAGLDPAALAPAPVGPYPPVYADRVHAWSARAPGRPDVPVAVAAAELDGRPVYFAVREPWADAAPPPAPGLRSVVLDELDSPLTAAVTLGLGGMCLWLAARNLRAGRGDRRGAVTVGLAVAAASLLGWAATAHHAAAPRDEVALLFEAAARAVTAAGFLAVAYLALEPEVRRRWPDTEVAWNRLLAGRVGDRLVATHVLLGALAGVAVALLSHADRLASRALGQATLYPEAAPMVERLGAGSLPAALAGSAVSALAAGVLTLLVLVALSRVLRTRWAAGAGFAGLVVAVSTDFSGGGWVTPAVGVVISAVLLTAALRLGLLALITAYLYLDVLTRFPLGPDLSAWHASWTAVPVGLLAAVAGAAGWGLARAPRA